MPQDSTENRLRLVERRLRRCQYIMGAALIFGVVAMLLGQDDEDAVQTTRIRRMIIESPDKSSIQMGKHTDAKGNERFGIFLVDAKATPRCMLFLDKDRPSLVLVDKEGASRTTLHLDKDGQPSLELADKGGKTRLQTIVFENGDSEVILYDQQASPRIGLISHDDSTALKINRSKSGAEIFIGANDQGWAAARIKAGKELPTATMGFIQGRLPTGFHVMDEPKELVRASFGVDGAGASLRFWDAKKNERGVLSVGDNGSTRFTVKGSSNAGLTTGVTSDGDVTFHVTDRDGKPVFKAP